MPEKLPRPPRGPWVLEADVRLLVARACKAPGTQTKTVRFCCRWPCAPLWFSLASGGKNWGLVCPGVRNKARQKLHHSPLSNDLGSFGLNKPKRWTVQLSSAAARGHPLVLFSEAGARLFLVNHHLLLPPQIGVAFAQNMVSSFVVDLSRVTKSDSVPHGLVRDDEPLVPPTPTVSSLRRIYDRPLTSCSKPQR